MEPVRALLTQLIDFAGLFPPAELGMQDAVRNYAAYRRGHYSWALGRLIIPVSRLEEFERIIHRPRAREPERELWRISALVGSNLPNDLLKISAFNQHHEGAATAVIDTIEVKVERAEDIGQSARLLPQSIMAYYEIPIANDPGDLIAAIAETGMRAKVRSGGIVPEAFPTSADLARFLLRCAAARVAFKATAGLHHPIRSIYGLTHAKDSPRGTMHGFMNVFLAATWVYAGQDVERVVALLEESVPKNLHFDTGHVTWQSERLSVDQIARARSEFAIAFGSCSFTEPIEDLVALRWL